MKRINVLIREDQYRRIKAEAAARGCPMSELIRLAIELHKRDVERGAGRLNDMEFGFLIGTLAQIMRAER